MMQGVRLPKAPPRPAFATAGFARYSFAAEESSSVPAGDFEIMPSLLGPTAGEGAFYTGARTIQRGELMGHYVGVPKVGHATHSDYCLGVESDDDICLDAANLRHWTSKMNDGGRKRNNVGFFGDSECRATRKIKPGDELYVSYGASYWESRQHKKV